jgi:cytochrome P450
VAAPAAPSLPPGPRLPRLLQTLGFIFFPAPFLAAARRRYGEIVTFSTSFDSGFVMVFDPGAIKEIFRASPDRLRAGEANAVLEPVVGRRSLLLLDGEEHLRQRRLMLPPFHGQRLKTYERVMREATDHAIEEWPVGQPFVLLPSMQSLTLEVIMSAIFGIEEGARREELKRRVRSLLEPISPRLSLVLFALLRGRFGDRGTVRRFEARRRALDELIYDEIARRRESPDLDQREDVFSMLLCARDDAGAPLSDRELRDELVTLLVAGHETTATGLAWAFDLVLHAPAVLDKLTAELARGDDVYLDAVIKETLRLRAVVPGIGRVVRGEPFALGSYLVPPGVEINPSIALTHRRPDHYPEPDAFRPERFLGAGAPDTYTWIPFGGGTRRCLGASFALYEMRTVIRRVLERTQLEATEDGLEKILRRGVTQIPKGGVRVMQRAGPAPA